MVHLPEREIPVPTSVSPEAQAALSMGRLGPPPREYPALDDVAGWKAYVAEVDGFVHTMIGDLVSHIGTAITEYTSRHVQLNVWTDIFFFKSATLKF